MLHVLLLLLLRICVSFNVSQATKLHLYAPNSAVIHRDFHLICQTSGRVTGIRWKRDGDNIAVIMDKSCTIGEGSKNWFQYFCIDDKFILKIPHYNMTEQLHQSVWSCADLFGGFSDNKTIYILIPVPEVRIANDPNNDIDFVEGNMVQIVCATGLSRPPPNITFVRGKDEITKNFSNTYTNLTNDMFVTRATWNFTVSRNDNGIEVHCKAANIIDQGYVASKSIYLNIKYGPGRSIMYSPYSQSVRIHENTSLETVSCRADCNPPCDISWWNKTITVSNDNELVLNNVSRHSAGLYICKATNDFGNGEAKLIIIVLYPPIIKDITLSDEVVKENDTLQMKCKADSYPPATITWLKDGIALEGNKSLFNDLLLLGNAKCLDTGKYTCAAQNGVGKPDYLSRWLFVNCKPRLDSTMTQQIGTTLFLSMGSYLRIKAQYIAYPAPNVAWSFRSFLNSRSKNSSMNRNAETFKEYNVCVHKFSLFLAELNQSDFGRYTIRVSNQHGESSSGFIVKRKGEFTSDTKWNGKATWIAIILSGFSVASIITALLAVMIKRRRSRLDEKKKQASEDTETDERLIYQNRVRILELASKEPYQVLDDDDPVYNASHYSNIENNVEEYYPQDDDQTTASPYQVLDDDDPVYNASHYSNIENNVEEYYPQDDDQTTASNEEDLYSLASNIYGFGTEVVPDDNFSFDEEISDDSLNENNTSEDYDDADVNIYQYSSEEQVKGDT